MLSGGMDSAAIAYVERPDGCLTIDYGQSAAAGEIRASRAIAESLDIPHEVIHIDCRAFGSGDMAGRPAASAAPVPEWWPFRNQMLLTTAAMYLVASGPAELLIGTVTTDAEHADGRAAFVAAMDALLASQEGGIRVRAPAIQFTTVGYVIRHAVPRDLLGWAHSCHVGEWACGECRGCTKYNLVWQALANDSQNA
jgi:7-cyano-7-deazaguanine synthase